MVFEKKRIGNIVTVAKLITGDEQYNPNLIQITLQIPVIIKPGLASSQMMSLKLINVICTKNINC